jgi:hypothetical protein
MSATILDLNHYEIRQFYRREFTQFKPSYFEKLERKIKQKTNLIKNEWGNFSLEERESWQKLAYDLIDYVPVRANGLNSFLMQIRVRAYMLFLKAIGQEKAFYSCVNALDYLVDEILNAVECGSYSYQQELLATLEEVKLIKSEAGEHNNGNGSDTRRWLQELSAQELA